MKRILISILLLCSVCTANAYTTEFGLWGLGVGYSKLFESHGSSQYNFKNDQLNIFLYMYNFYIDGSIGFSQPSPSDDNQKLGSWGMDFGYGIPIFGKNKKRGIYITPVAGFQKVGIWYSYVERGCHYPYGYYKWTGFHTYNTYVNYGGLVTIVIDNFMINLKATRMTFGASIGFRF